MDYGNVASAVRAGVIGQSIILDGVEREIIGVLRPNGGDCRARLRFTFLWKICARTKTTWIVENIRILRTAGRLKPNVTLAQATADLNNIAAELERRIPIQCWTPRHWLILLDSAVKDYKRGVTLASGRGRLCASHRLRQCRELTARVARLARTRAGGARPAAKPRPARPASVGRKRNSRRGRRHRRCASRALGTRCHQSRFPAGSASFAPLTSRVFRKRILTSKFSPSQPRWRSALVVLVGVWPALRVSRTASLTLSLHEGGRGTSDGAQRQRIRSGLVVAQVALALLLLAGAGLTLKSFHNAQNARLGFNAGTF